MEFQGGKAMKLRATLATMLLAFAGFANAQMNALPQARHILVYGQAQARAIPDRFKIEINFDVVDQKADVARAKVESMMQDTLRKLRAAGVPDGEIVSTSLEIEPRQEYSQELKKQVYKGIAVERSITARFSELAKLKQFLSVLHTSEELQVSGVTTTLSTEAELKRQLRAKAIESTKEKAGVIAKSYGARLAGLYSVSDTAPKFEYGIQEGDWPVVYEWRHTDGSAPSPRNITSVALLAPGTVHGAAGSTPESFESGYVTFNDTIYAVFLIGD